MKILNFFKSSIKVIAFVSLTILQMNAFAQGQTDEPNIIVIYTDDWGYSDIENHNIKDDIITPKIKELAESGVLMTNGYVTSPQCAPSRAGFLTCKYQQRFNFDAIPSLPLRVEEKTIADHLKSFGYKTGMVGKWHLDVDPFSADWAHEFAPHAVYPQGGTEKVDMDLVSADLKEPYNPGNRGFDEYYWGTRNNYLVNFPPYENTVSGEEISVGGSRVDQKTNASLDFIERNANQDEPFFLYTAYYAPHSPLNPSNKYLNQIPASIESDVRRKGLALMLAVDTGVGQIIDKLKELDIYENTIVIFASDNGAPITQYIYDSNDIRVGRSYVDEDHPDFEEGMRLVWNGSDNAPLTGDKGMLSEGGIRVPMMISWPQKINGNQTFTRNVYTLDLVKTFLTAAGDVSALPELDGLDLLPFLTGEENSSVLAKRSIFWRFYTQTAIRKGRWKLLRVSDEIEYLFDLNTDKEEKINLIEQYPQRAINLREELADWAATTSFPSLPTEPRTGAESMKYELYFGGQDIMVNVMSELAVQENSLKAYRDGDVLHVISDKTITNITVLDSFGAVVLEITDGQTSANISGLPVGVYTVYVTEDNEVNYTKVLL